MGLGRGHNLPGDVQTMLATWYHVKLFFLDTGTNSVKKGLKLRFGQSWTRRVNFGEVAFGETNP